MSQLDIFGEAQALKADGQARADASQPKAWKDNVDYVITTLARRGEPFTSDDVSAVTGDSPTGSRGAMGSRFTHAARRGVIRRIGYVPSRRPSVHAHPVAQWIGDRGCRMGQSACDTRENVGVLRVSAVEDAGYYKGSKDGSGLRANGDRPLRSTRSRLDRDEVTP